MIFSTDTYLGLARIIYIHRIWTYIWWFPCQKYRICTVDKWLWATLAISHCVDLLILSPPNRTAHNLSAKATCEHTHTHTHTHAHTHSSNGGTIETVPHTHTHTHTHFKWRHHRNNASHTHTHFKWWHQINNASHMYLAVFLVHTAWLFIWTHTAQRSLLNLDFWCTLPGCLFGHTRPRGACSTLCSGAYCLDVYLDTHGPEEPANLVFWCMLPGCLFGHTRPRGACWTLCFWCTLSGCVSWTHGSEEPA